LRLDISRGEKSRVPLGMDGLSAIERFPSVDLYPST